MNNAHPGLPEFEYLKPQNFEEASQFLVKYKGESRPFMGGTDVFVRMRDGVWKDKYLVDVKNLDSMKDISFTAGKGLILGAAVNMNRVAQNSEINHNYPLLIEAANSVASYQLRNRATVGGNICNSSPAGDTIGACIVFDAKLVAYGANGEFETPISTFFKGPGQNILKTGEFLTKIKFPIPPQGAQGRYLKLGRNKTGDLAIVGVTVLGYPNPASPSGYTFRLAIASVAAKPLIPQEAENILEKNKIDEAIIEKAANAAMETATPIDDTRGSARYRKLMVRNLTKNALIEVMKKLK